MRLRNIFFTHRRKPVAGEKHPALGSFVTFLVEGLRSGEGEGEGRR
jgi:hypothetical protein